MYFCLHSSSLHSIAMRRENPSKVHNVWTPSWHPCTRIWLSATLVALCGSSAAHVSISQWQKATFFVLPSQYGDIYTLFFKDRYFVRKTFSLPVFSVAASKLLWHMTLMSLFFKEVDDKKCCFFCFFAVWSLQWPKYCRAAASYCQCCQFVFVR